MPGRLNSSSETDSEDSRHSRTWSWSNFILGKWNGSHETASHASKDVEQLLAATQLHSSNGDSRALASQILTIINRYRLSALQDGAQASSTKFFDQISSKTSASEPILMCLPAFPFKSPNTSSKVLGQLPDKAEEFALAHMNGLCAAITQVYKPGARLMIISDGLVYNGMSCTLGETIQYMTNIGDRPFGCPRQLRVGLW